MYKAFKELAQVNDSKHLLNCYSIFTCAVFISICYGEINATEMLKIINPPNKEKSTALPEMN